MKFVSFLKNNIERAGILVNNNIFDLEIIGNTYNIDIPSKMGDILNNWSENLIKSKKIEKNIIELENKNFEEKNNIIMLAPVPKPTSCRDGYAFRQHVFTARRNRGLEMIPEFDQYPIFYFTNHNSIIGEGDLVVENDHLANLDFELEVAIVIGKEGKNIDSKEADSFIAGYTIMNDFSARVLQMEEMKLNLGPAKGKDFATSIGPYLVTVDELEKYKVKTEFGDKYNLKMTAYHNGKLISEGNLIDMNWTFAEIIERASYGVKIYPSDVIGSGTVGTGCYLELNGTNTLLAKEKGETFTPVWLKEGDLIELEVEGLGKLSHKIVKSQENISILKKKKL
ncbi:MAG: fumarylacetoacetate hydrolase family protein [Candidatus Sericytochromatia bacterium]